MATSTLSTEELQLSLQELSAFVSDIKYYPSLASTNELAMQLIKSGASAGTLILADHQSNGKGRNGHNWESEVGVNLLFSLILKPQVPTHRLPVMSLLCALAVSQALASHTELTPEIKWPNDVLLDGRKVCGILNESTIMGKEASYVILGIGCNVNQTIFPEDLAQSATSLKLATGKEFDRKALLTDILKYLWPLYKDVERGDYKAHLGLWTGYCRMLGKEIEYIQQGQTQSGIAEDIDENGRLVVRHSDENRVLSQAEISKIKY